MSQPIQYADHPQQLTTVDRAWGNFTRIIAAGGWIVLVIMLLLLASGVFAALGGPLAMFFGLVLGLVLMVTWGTWRRIARARRAGVLLGHLRVGVTLNLPLPMVLSGAAASETGRTRRQLVMLRELLLGGTPIGAALTQVAPELSPRTLDAIAAAERNGALVPTLARLAGEVSGAEASSRVRASLQGTYALLMMMAMIGVIGALMIFVMPRFQQILKDFKVLAPPELVLMMTIAREFQWPMVVLMLIIPLGLADIGGSAARSVFVAGLPQPLWRGFSDWLRWHLPLSHSIQHDRGLADACDVFADGIAAGRPAADALDVAIQPSLNRHLARKLSMWSDLVRHGRPLHEAAVDAGLPRMFGVMLAPGFAADGSPQALRFLARYHRDRNERLVAVLRAAITPVATLLLGSIVLLLTSGLFRAMVVLINAVETTGVRP